MKRTKQDWELTIEERIERAGWFHGSERDWQSLPLAERDRLAFAATGCAVAYCTWQAPVNGCHIGCRVMRGEIPAICQMNHALLAEKGNWLRGLTESKAGRKRLAAMFRAFRKQARATGVYDPWKIGWQAIVYGGLEVAS